LGHPAKYTHNVAFVYHIRQATIYKVGAVMEKVGIACVPNVPNSRTLSCISNQLSLRRQLKILGQ